MKKLFCLIFIFSLVGCARGFIRKEMYINDVPHGGLAVCTMHQACIEAAERFCFPAKVGRRVFYEESSSRPYFDQGFSCWRDQHSTKLLLEFRCEDRE